MPISKSLYLSAPEIIESPALETAIAIWPCCSARVIVPYSVLTVVIGAQCGVNLD